MKFVVRDYEIIILDVSRRGRSPFFNRRRQCSEWFAAYTRARTKSRRGGGVQERRPLRMTRDCLSRGDRVFLWA